MADPAAERARQVRLWTLGSWVWLLVAVLNLVIVALRLAAGWPPEGANLVTIMLSLVVFMLGCVLFFVYRAKAQRTAAGTRRDE